MNGERTLQAFTFAKYRAFEEAQTLELKPLTLLFGHNSAGKSAALRLLPILAAATSFGWHGSESSVLDYSSIALRNAIFTDLVNNGQHSAAMQFGFIWSDARFSATLQHLGMDGEVVSSFSAQLGDEDVSGSLSDPGRRKCFQVKIGDDEDVWSLEGLRPQTAESVSGKQFIDTIGKRLGHFAQSVHWLGAVRAAVPRYFELRPGADGTIKYDGTGVAESLRLSAMRGDGAAQAVSKWLAATCGCTLSFATTDEEIVFNRQFYPFSVVSARGAQIAVRDVGEGVAQALPVVMLCHLARVGKLGSSPILAFEQPELHLHPAAMVSLANEIVSCITDGSPARHVIETHAESMLLALQIAIVEKRIKPEDVIVYWVAPGESGTSLRPIYFDEEGFPVGGWPQGVFRETLDQARRLSMLRLQQSEP